MSLPLWTAFDRCGIFALTPPHLTDMNSFAWFVFNCFVTIGWLATAIVTGNWFLAVGSGIWVAVLVLVDLPGSTTSDEDSNDDEDGGLL